MLKRIKQTNKEGFTIIEVMIVLAIAALILLIVFLAVPALQRTSRNTQRKNDISSLNAAVDNYETNNQNTLPATISLAYDDAKLGYYSTANVYTTATAAALVTAAATPALGGVGSNSSLTTEDILYSTGVTCNGNTPTTTGATTRSYVLLYAIETSGAAQTQCIGD